jgi:haloalkane dehalogenase
MTAGTPGGPARILATPDGVADGLADFAFSRRFVEVPHGLGGGGTMRIAVVEAGDPAGRPVVFLHGNPSWSYIWRHQLAAVADAGYRAIALDLGGMGLSDKPAELADYTVARHVAWMRSAIFDALALDDVTFVLHDWGLIIGLRLVAEQPGRVARVVASNSGLPVRDPSQPLPPVIEARGPYAAFQEMVRDAPVWEPWTMLPGCMVTAPSAELTAAYRAPYPDPALTIGSRAFTQLLPTRPDNPMLADNFAALAVLRRFERPVLTIFSDRDIVAPDGWRDLVAWIPGAAGQPHVILEGGGHFLQEDLPEAYSAALCRWLADTA